MGFFLLLLSLCLLLYAWKLGSEMVFHLLPHWGWRQTICGSLLRAGLCAADENKTWERS